MTWWTWLILGAFIFGAELIAIDAQFYLIFIGLSAVLVGLLELAGVNMPDWVQWIVFASVSLIFMFSFRRALYEKIRGDVPGFHEGVAGESITIASVLAAGQQGRVSFRGTDWTVINEGSNDIAAGTRIDIARSEGLTLFVNADG